MTERPHFTTSDHGRPHNGGGGDGRPNNGWEVWHRRRTTASLSRRHTGSERRTRARPKVNSIRKIYYLYNAQISLNKPSFATLVRLRDSSPSISTVLLVHVGTYCEKFRSRRLQLYPFSYDILLLFFFIIGPYIGVTGSLRQRGDDTVYMYTWGIQPVRKFVKWPAQEEKNKNYLYISLTIWEPPECREETNVGWISLNTSGVHKTL